MQEINYMLMKVFVSFGVDHVKFDFVSERIIENSPWKQMFVTFE